MHGYASEDEIVPGSVVVLHGRHWLMGRVEPNGHEGRARALAKPARYRMRLLHPDGREELGAFRQYGPAAPKLATRSRRPTTASRAAGKSWIRASNGTRKASPTSSSWPSATTARWRSFLPTSSNTRWLRETFGADPAALKALADFYEQEGSHPPWQHAAELLRDGLIDVHFDLTPRGRRALARVGKQD
jgi:hypothetical protein